MRDRDPITWSFPLPWRPLGVTIRVHVLFPVVIVGIVLGVLTGKQFASGLGAQACIVLALLFVCVLLHELGHVIAARRLDGDANEILLWPLGGLTFVEVPRSARAYCWAALAGPAVNLFLAAAAAGALVALGFVPPLNPLISPLNPHLYSWKDGINYASRPNPGEVDYWKYTDPATGQLRQAEVFFEKRKLPGADKDPNALVLRESNPEITSTADRPPQWLLKQAREQDKRDVPVDPARLGNVEWLLAQFFFVNWFLLLVNLLPAFPLDGGRLVQCLFWRKADYRQATASAAYVGFLTMMLVGIFAIAVNDLLPALLAVMIYVQCRRELFRLEESEEKAPGSYDFSQGYTSLEREEDDDAPPPPPPPPKLNWLQRWVQRRQERRLERARDHARRRRTPARRIARKNLARRHASTQRRRAALLDADEFALPEPEAELTQPGK